MSKEVNSAVGTQRQFSKQPENPYALRLNPLQVGKGIAQRTDYDAQVLARSLGLLGENLMRERIADERRSQEQAVLVNADKMLEGKTQEDLRKFDRMAALQNATDAFDLTDNRYAMAVLEKGIGQMASTYAKQQWMNDPKAEKPKTVDEAVGLYHQYLQSNRESFEEDSTIQNRAAFDQGYYEGAMRDTLKVAEEADRRINEDKRQKMVMLGCSELQDVLSSNMQGEEFNNLALPALRKIQLGTKDAKGFMTTLTPILQMASETGYSTNQLNSLANYEYEEGLRVKDMISLYPYYKKIATNIDYKIADDIFSKNLYPDGTLDFSSAQNMLAALPHDMLVGTGVPEVSLPISGADNPDVLHLDPALKGALGCVGGALYQLGYNDAQITSGYRDSIRNAQANGVSNSRHLEGKAVDIWLGNTILTADQQAQLTSYFGQYFGEVLFHDAGSGNHLHLADYKGGMKGADAAEQSAAAYSPQRMRNITNLLNAKANEAERIKRQKLRVLRENTSNAVLGCTDEVAAISLIENSGLPINEQQKMLATVRRKFKKDAERDINNLSAQQLWCLNYENSKGKETLADDTKIINAWLQAKDDPNFDEHPFMYGKGIESWDDLQEKANDAVARRNLYWTLSCASTTPVVTQASNTQIKTEGNPSATAGNNTAGTTKSLSEVKLYSPPVAPDDTSKAQIRDWALSNPIDSETGYPLSLDEIQNKIVKWAEKNNIDYTELMPLLNEIGKHYDLMD